MKAKSPAWSSTISGPNASTQSQKPLFRHAPLFQTAFLPSMVRAVREIFFPPAAGRGGASGAGDTAPPVPPLPSSAFRAWRSETWKYRVQ